MNKSTGVLLVVIAGVIVAGIAWMYKSSPSTVPTATEMPEETLAPEGDATGGAFVQQAPSTSPAASPTGSPVTSAAATTGMTVSITDAGFDPSTVTVPVGSTVTFVNNGSKPHWPASDPHPTHTGYPGFDAKRGLATGESFSFTFSKVGSWGFHDHLNASLRGMVVVQ